MSLSEYLLAEVRRSTETPTMRSSSSALEAGS